MIPCNSPASGRQIKQNIKYRIKEKADFTNKKDASVKSQYNKLLQFAVNWLQVGGSIDTGYTRQICVKIADIVWQYPCC